MLPTVDFCGLGLTRLVLGGNPFGGFSHQSQERDQAMVAYHTPERIRETWARAEEAGINAMVTNNESEHVVKAVRSYIASGGKLRWIAQVNCRKKNAMREAIDEVLSIGATAIYFHGMLIDDAFAAKDEAKLRDDCGYVRSKNVPVGVAAHVPEAHLWVDELGIADFHAVCLFNCGSVHAKSGQRFRLGDMAKALAVVRRIQKPCIAYKIMGAGRIDPRMAFEYALSSIKPTDVANVGMHRGDDDAMVAKDAAMVRELLGA
jgi:hypothetical protein